MLSEAPKKSCNKQSFKIAVRSAAEILTLSVYLNVKGDFRQPILLDLFDLVVPGLETVRALGGYIFNSVGPQM